MCIRDSPKWTLLADFLPALFVFEALRDGRFIVSLVFHAIDRIYPCVHEGALNAHRDTEFVGLIFNIP